MRNLKRTLSLALASVMLVGMMSVGASAVNASDFTDADEIVNKDAVSTMTALGIINGKEDGSYFDPTGNVTRAEMAKMLCVAINGGVDPVLGVKDTPTFTDIKGHWAESYIEYCAANGIIAGRGNNKFDPTGTVSATEAAKMLLGVLGCVTILPSLILVLDKPLKGLGIFRAIVIIPWVVPQAFAATMWRWVLNAQFGFLNQLLMALGLIEKNISFLSEPHKALAVCVA